MIKIRYNITCPKAVEIVKEHGITFNGIVASLEIPYRDAASFEIFSPLLGF